MNTTFENNKSTPLKVAFLCRSDSLGGAAVVTNRLVQALRNDDVDARLVVIDKQSQEDYVHLATDSKIKCRYPFYLERLEIALSNGFSRENLFKGSTASTGIDLASHPDIVDADVVALSWVNQGMISLNGIKKISQMGKPIVWIMHDMWNMTGFCHHSLDCDHYTQQCGSCKFLKSNKSKDLSHRTWKKKFKLYNDVPITFVAVSNWLAECARRSSLLSNKDVRVIPNAFPIDTFTTEPTRCVENIPSEKQIIVMGAARLDDPIKGLNMAVEALNRVAECNPEIARDSLAVFFGALRDETALSQLKFPHIHLGMIKDSEQVRQLYARASVVISSSLFETLPGTLIEGQAAGALAVSFNRGGQADIIDHKKSGYLAQFGDTDDLARGVVWALQNPVDRKFLHEQVRSRFASDAVAQRFKALFNELLNR